MDGGYSQGGAPPPHMMGYFQGMPTYNMSQTPMSASSPTIAPGAPSASSNPVTATGAPGPNAPTNSARPTNSVSIWAGDLDAYMDESFLRQAVTTSGWGSDITRIKVVRDHYSGMHAGYGFLDAASPEAAERVIRTGSGLPIPGTNRCWRLNMGRNAAASTSLSVGTESNVYVGNLEPSVTDYQLMTAFRPRFASVRHAKVVCNEYGQSRGFGFVRFANPQDAERAVAEMNGYVFNQKPIRLSPAAGRNRGAGCGLSPALSGAPAVANALATNSAGNPSMRGAAHGTSPYHHHHHHHHHGPPLQGAPANKRPRQLMSPDDPNNTTIFIGGTSSHITEELLWREFSTFGELEAVRVPINKTGFAFVRFKSRECAQRAKDEVSQTHYTSLNPAKPVRIEWASEQIPVARTGSLAAATAATMHSGGGTVYGANGYDGYASGHAAGDTVPSQQHSGTQHVDGAAAQHRYSNEYDTTIGSAETAHTEASGGHADIEAGSDSKNSRKFNAGHSTSADGVDNSCGGGDDEPGNGDLSKEIDGGVASNGGESEPPSKRVAVGRPEYAGGASNGVSGDGVVGVTSRTAERNGIGGKSDGTAEESPAMQFSWLNASSTQTASNVQ